jgi:hypothetical protein
MFYWRFDTLRSTTVPFGSTTTKNSLWIAPLIESEKQTSQNGTGVIRNSCVSGANGTIAWKLAPKFSVSLARHALVDADALH